MQQFAANVSQDMNKVFGPGCIRGMNESEKKSRLDRLYDKIESHGFDSLTPSEQSAFALRWFYLETNNGGLHQFFFNDAGRFAVDALRGLEFLGAQSTAEILRRAMSVFPGGAVPSDMEQRRDFLIDSMTPKQEKLLNDLTTEFLRSSEPVADLLTAYIERHPDQFPT